MLRDVLTALVGLGTGVLSAAFGVGGAVVSTPALRALGLPATLAVGTTLPSVLPSAISGSLRYARLGLVDWRAVRVAMPAGVVASVVGALLSRRVPGEGHGLMIATAALLAVTSWRTARGAEPAAAGPQAREPSTHILVAVGASAGALSGLLGVGGGIVMVPGFAELAGMPLRRAIATSLVGVGCLAVPGTVTHALLGGIDWRFAALLAVFVVPGARLGAAVSIRAGDRSLRLAVGVFLGVVAALYFSGEVIALAAG